ncbi:helix-turn-helix domain-containing protein [Streptomyces sp. ID05-04B]|uniref:helix-turn-helix domain-containing protein n=1 Tax=unclassified Streptomyces TaxID=2593676 RepID=UPI000D19A163|nr:MULTISPECIES: helix-turn-helix domain-containing protein [unclassified Streptomyces]AVV48025.1 PucR family transcriptional regulator [Streptomyces sp. P3]MDX5565046.1 helix-turn-helix domain-containing protein [Streptomyces sp. ID05-04B]
MAGRDDDDLRSGAPDDAGPAWAQTLLDHVRPTGRDVPRLVEWLSGTVEASVSLRDGDGVLVAGRHTPVDETLAAGITHGRLASAAWEGEGRHVRLIRVELPEPAAFGVLAVSRTTPFDRRASDIVAHTVGVLELLLRARETAATGHRLARATAALRLAILQLLMVEDVVAARRVAAGLWPRLLDTDTACVYVLESTPEERDGLAAACLAATHEETLVVRCPAMDGHVIVVVPDDAAGSELRALCGGRPGAFLGASVRQSLARTATAYGQAVSALAVARFRPDRTAAYAERTRPERLMDPDGLRTWTTRLLRPLDTLPHHTRAELLATTRLGLEFTAVNAAKVLGVSRNTVRARMERVENLLRADLSDLTVRAIVHLALHHQFGIAEDPAGAPAGPVQLGELLTGPALRTWALELLARLDTDGRDLRGTLRAWIAAGGNAERAAHLLGVHAQTVREHVRSAEPVLERQLLAAGSDLYEVVLAHVAAGDLDQPDLYGSGHPAESGHPDSPVHR